jgi:BirA family transcriptional regulator, biotin operon repressor / biotin---[acetyl-CoA-carboxylase] ligase
VTAALPAAYRLVDLDTVASTNDEAMRLAADGAPEGLMVRAREQTAGRGRRGRAFVSPPGNLYLSLVLRPDTGPDRAALAGFAVSLAMAETIDRLAPQVPAATCKWPNDILVAGRKVGAVLIEASSTQGSLDWLVVGMGVNLVSHPAIADYPAGDLAELGAPGITPDIFLGVLAERLDHWLDVWRRSGMIGLRAAWLARAAGLGQDIQVRLENESFGGRFRDLDTDGALMLDMDDGRCRRVTAGAVFFPEAA